MTRFVLVAPFALVLAACGGASDGAESTVPATTPATTPVITSAESDVSATPAPTTVSPATTTPDPVPGAEIVGRWAHYDVVAYQGDTLKSLIISYGFNTFSEVDGQIVDSTEFCFSEQRTDQPIETKLSDAATQAIKPPETPVDVDIVDGTLRLRRAATPTPVGIRLDDPANDRLPTDPNDPRLVDDDGDGNLGITVQIIVTDDLTGELYIARREIFAYEAFLTEPDVLMGTVTDDSEQLVIGASDPIFATSDGNWAQLADPDKSPIILERVEADWDCARLASERDGLFPPTPTVDW